MNVAIYCRVSTKDQTCENQLKELREIASNANWNVVDTYIDQGISGAKGRDKRPEFDRMCCDMNKHKFKKVLTWDISRLGRSLVDLVAFLQDLQSVDCDLFVLQSALDTSTPSGRAMFSMISIFSQYEREMIAERVKAGLNRAKSEGKKLGRKSIIDNKLSSQVKTLRDEGFVLTEIAKSLGVSLSTVKRCLGNIRVEEDSFPNHYPIAA